VKVADKVWVVTGAGNGIGRALLLELVRRGARVAAADRDAVSLKEALDLADVGDRVSAHVVDVTDRAAVAALPAEVLARHGRVDGLLNNAGIIQPFVTVGELDELTIERVLDVNLRGTISMVQAFLPSLMARPEAHIANVSSMGGFFPFPGQSIYGASKAAVKILTEGLYAELLDTGVRVSVVFPGAVKTSISTNSGVEEPTGADDSKVPMTTPEKAARIMLDGIEKDRLHIYVGPDARLMSIAVKIAPRPAIKLVRRLMAKHLEPSTP